MNGTQTEVIEEDEGGSRTCIVATKDFTVTPLPQLESKDARTAMLENKVRNNNKSILVVASYRMRTVEGLYN